MFISDLVSYIADNTTLVQDTNLFIGADEPDAPNKAVFVSEFAGGDETWSGLISHPVQVLVRDLTYLLAETLAYEVYDVLANKAGFSGGVLDVFYCEVLNRPFAVGRNERGCYIFSSNFLFRMT